MDPPQSAVSLDAASPKSVGRKQACERCWRRKQKCDRERPVCSNCRDAGVTCAPRTISISGEEDGVIAHGDGYIQTLKRRVKHLEQLQHRKRTRLDGAEARHAPATRDSVPTSQLGHDIDPQVPRPSDVSVRDALKEFGQFALNVSDSNKVAHSTSFNSWYFVKMAMCSPGSERSLYSAQRSELLAQPLDLQRNNTNSLLKRYNESILKIYPFISQEELFELHYAVLQADSDHSTISQSKHGLFIVYMALATVCSSNNRSSVLDLLASKLWAHASTISKDVGNGHSIQSMVSLALCALHGQGHECLPQIIAVAMTRAIALGFHRLRYDPGAKVDRSDHDEKRRLFWIIYVLDRLVSFTMGYPHTLADQDISTEPMELRTDVLEAREDQDFYLVQMIEHSRLLSILHRNNHRPRIYFTSLYQSWLESTPLRAKSAEGPAVKEVFLRLKCRLLVAIHNALGRDHTASTIEQSMLDEEDLEDTLTSCADWLRCLEINYDSSEHLRCVTDQYEIASIGIMCAEIQNNLPLEWSSSLSRLCGNVKTLSISLLSYLSAIYPAAAQMRRAISALDGSDLERLSDLACQDQWSALVPRPIREAIARWMASFHAHPT